MEVEKNEFDFKILEFESRNDDTVDVKIRVVETTKYKGFDNNSKYNEVYRLRLVKEDGAWKVLKVQDGSCYIERFVKPEPERDKKGYEDMQSKIEAHFTRQNFIKSDTEEFLDRLEFNYNEYMKRRVEEEKLIKKEEEMKEQAEVTIKADKEEITDYEEIIEAPEFFYVLMNTYNFSSLICNIYIRIHKIAQYTAKVIKREDSGSAFLKHPVQFSHFC